MGDLFNSFNSVPQNSTNRRAQTLLDYEKAFAGLLRDCKNEIEQLHNMLKAQREEKEKFFSETLPEIERKMREDDVNSEYAKEWILKLTESMERSFQMSESLVEAFCIDSMDKFKEKLNDVLDKV